MDGNPGTSSSQQPSSGLVWGVISLLLDLVEVTVLVEMIFFDQHRTGLSGGFGLFEVYFVFTLLTAIGQATGVILVTRKKYRLGGIFQIVSSGLQVIKLDGIFGVIGGIKAYRLSRYLAGKESKQGSDATVSSGTAALQQVTSTQ